MTKIWMYSTISEASSQVNIKRKMRLFCYNVPIVTHLSWGHDHHCFFSGVHNRSVNLFGIFAIIFISSRICVTECTFVLIFLVQYWNALVIWLSHFWHLSQSFISWEGQLYAFQAYESRTEVGGCICEGALDQELHLQREEVGKEVKCQRMKTGQEHQAKRVRKPHSCLSQRIAQCLAWASGLSWKAKDTKSQDGSCIQGSLTIYHGPFECIISHASSLKAPLCGIWSLQFWTHSSVVLFPLSSFNSTLSFANICTYLFLLSIQPLHFKAPHFCHHLLPVLPPWMPIRL